ncbi:GGDEF domain-containing protein [Chungangia koreensis]|uniref:GGDEF domain-containing protein n=1 Tax=Chungangia koreensis TaxID=752657 RepID=A0ABV8X6M8_9LACT
MIAYIGDIAKKIPEIPLGTACELAEELFTAEPGIQGIAIMDDSVPVALMTRMNFYQKMGTRYGYNLYMKRPIELLANNKPLIVDFFMSVTEVSKLAMERPEEELYDYILVNKDHRLFGAVSIKDLLMKVADIQAELASYLNPLTRLPGNNIIQEQLYSAFESKEPFSVLYIDLDRFKAYNDTYGFKKGDELLQATASILNDHMDQNETFLGHIGGDDYIVILKSYDYEEYCRKVISSFEERVKSFYTEEHLQQKFVSTENRSGSLEEFPLVSISIAVVTNRESRFEDVEEIIVEAARVKKLCKSIVKSCYHSNEPQLQL